MLSIEEDEGDSTREEWGYSSASDPFYARDTLISSIPWVCKLITWFLPTNFFDIMIYFMISVAATICTMDGMCNLP